MADASQRFRRCISLVFSVVYLPGHTQRCSLGSPGAPTPHGSAQRLSCAVIRQPELVWTTLQIVKEHPVSRSQPLLLCCLTRLLASAWP